MASERQSGCIIAGADSYCKQFQIIGEYVRLTEGGLCHPSVENDQS